MKKISECYEKTDIQISPFKNKGSFYTSTVFAILVINNQDEIRIRKSNENIWIGSVFGGNIRRK